MRGVPAFDLIVVGSGLTGLAAADQWLTAAPEGTAVAILEQNHRPGGAAIAHTHRYGEEHFVAPGGAIAVTRPRSFEGQALETLESLGFRFEEFEHAYDPGHFVKLGCRENGLVFCRAGDDSGTTRSSAGKIWETPLCRKKHAHSLNSLL